jgi:hypothetical protein
MVYRVTQPRDGAKAGDFATTVTDLRTDSRIQGVELAVEDGVH